MSFFSKKEQKKNKLDDTSMDDDLDFDFSSMDDEFDVDSKSRTPIQRVASGIKSSVKSTASNPGTYKKLMLKALPEEYTQVHDELDNRFTKLTTATSDAVDKLRPELKTLANKVDKLIPENQRILRKIYDKTLGNYKEEDYGSSDRPDIQQEQITNALNEVFNKQNEVSLQMQARKAAEDGIKNKTEHNRFLTNLQVMSNVDSNLSAIRNYQDTVTQAYQKKTLELQYRSYFVQAETLKAIRDHAVASRAENKSIVKNTALPDFAKITAYEKVKDVFSTKFGEKLHSGIFGNSFVENITKSITSKIAEITDGIKMGIGSIDMASGMVDDKYETAGSIVGNGIASMVSDYGSKKLQKLIEKDPAMYKKVLTAGKKAMNVVSGNTDAYAERFANEKLKPDYLSTNGIKESGKELLADLIRGALGGPSLQMESARNTSMDKDGLFKPSVFTDKAHTSITEVIPGYLSRMLRELTIIRTGDALAPTQMFDYKSNKFSTYTAIAKQYTDKLLQSTDKDSYVGRNISSVSKDIAGDAPEETKAELDKFIGDITTSRMVYDSEGIRGSKAYANLSPSARQSVDNYLQQTEQDELLKVQFESRLSNIKNSYGDPRKDLEEGLRLGHGDILESLGLVTRDKDNLYKLDIDTYRNISTKGLEVKTPGKENVSKPIFNQIQDPVDRQAPAQPGSITATVDLLPLIQNDNTNASNLLNKIDELTNVVKNLKISVGGRYKSSYQGMSDAVSGGYAAFKEKIVSLKIPDSVKEYYERAVLTGKMSVEKAQEEINKLSKKTKFKDMTIGQIGSKALDGVKRAGNFAIDAGMKTANAAWGSVKWLGDKAVKTAKVAKDPVFNAMSKIFSTMVDFSKSAIEIGKDLLFNKLPSGLRSFKGAVSSITKTVNDYILSQDVYVAGEDKPRLFSRLLRNGFYRLQKDGKVIYTFKDISDTVVDSEGNVVISAEDIAKGLVDKNGEPLRTPFEKLTKFAVEGTKKAVLKTIATSKAIVEGTKKATTGVSNFIKRGFGIGGLAGNYGDGSSKESASMVHILGQIRDILLFKFKIKEKDIDKGASKDNEVPDEQISPITEQTTTTITSGDNSPRYNSSGSGILSSAASMATDAVGKLKGLFNRRGKDTDPSTVPSVGKKDILGKLGGLKSRALGVISGLFGNSGSNEQQTPTQALVDNQQPATTVTNTKNVINKEPVDVKQKNSYKARLAKLDEEAKNRHKFKQTEARARYEGGEGILGMFKKAYDFITNIMSVSGLGSLLTGVLSKIPVIGKLFGGAKVASAAGAATGAVAAKGAAGVATGVAKQGLIRGVIAKGAALLGSGLLSSAATAATTAATVVGKAAVGIGSAIGGLISTPVVIGTLAVAAVAYGGYRLYKHMTRNDLTEFEQIRYRQYGFDLDSDNHVSKLHIIKSLENYVLQSGIVITKENISISNKIDTKAFFGIVDIDPEKEKEKAQRFMDWFVVRFKPFFLKHCVAIYKANPKYKLFDLDKLTNDEKLVYLTTISSDLDGPYDYTEAPFQEMGRLAATKDIVKTTIEKAIQDVKSKLKKPSTSQQETQKLKTDIAAKAAEEARLAQQEARKIAEEASKPTVPPTPTPDDKSVAKPADVIKPQQGPNISDIPTANKAETTVAEGDGKEVKAPSNIKSDTNIPISNELRVAGGGLKDGRNAMQYITLNKSNIDIQNLDSAVKSTLFGMIEEYGELTGKKVVITDGFRSRAEQERLHKADPKKAAPPGKSLHEFGIAVDMDRNSYNEMESLGLMRKYGFTRPVGGEPWHAEPAGIQTDINRAKQDPNFRQAAIQAGLFKGGGGYGTDPSATKYRRNNKLAMSLLQDNGKPVDPNAIVTAAKGEDKPSGIAPVGEAPTLANTAVAPTPQLTKADAPAIGKEAVKLATADAGATASGIIPVSDTTTSNTSLKKVGSTQTFKGYEGNGQKTSDEDMRIANEAKTKPTEWNRIDTGSTSKIYTDTPSTTSKSIPSGFTNVKAKPEVITAIADAGNKIGVDPSKLMTMAAVESGLKPEAKAKTSSASGLFQFIKSTWKAIAPKVGLSPDANPLDPNDNALVGARYVKDNEIGLSKAGVKPGLLETYIAHFLGPGGARTFLMAEDSAIAAEVMPKAAAANKAIFYNNGKANTVGEVKQLLAKKLSTRAKEFGIPTDPSLAKAGISSDGNAKSTTATSNVGLTDSDPSIKIKSNDTATTALTSIDAPVSATNDTGNVVSSSTGPVTTTKDNITTTAPTGNVAPKAMYSKPSIPLGDEPISVPVKQSTSNAGQENYSKLISDSVSTSLGYQKSMVEHLASIDTNLIKALQDIISLGKQGAATPSSTGSNRSSKENLAPTIDMSRKKAMAT